MAGSLHSTCIFIAIYVIYVLIVELYHSKKSLCN